MSGQNAPGAPGDGNNNNNNRNMTVEIRDSETGEVMRTIEATPEDQRDIMVATMLARAREIYSTEPSKALELVLESVRQTRGEGAILSVLNDARSAYQQGQGQQQPQAVRPGQSQSQASGQSGSQTARTGPSPNSNSVSGQSSTATTATATGSAGSSVTDQLWGKAPSKQQPKREEKKPVAAPAGQSSQQQNNNNTLNASNASRSATVPNNNSIRNTAQTRSSSSTGQSQAQGQSQSQQSQAQSKPQQSQSQSGVDMNACLVDEGILEAALEDGSSEICQYCNAVLPKRRAQAHYEMWCPALYPD